MMQLNLRLQDDVLATIEVTNYLQACGSVVLVVRTAGEHEKSRAETEIYVINKAKHLCMTL